MADLAMEKRPAVPPLAIVFGGGGARAAYQVGVLRWLSRRRPDLAVPVLTGVSMGAINAIHLASARDSFPRTVERLSALWSGLTLERVARSDWRWVGSVVSRSLRRLVGAGPSARRAVAPLNTAPLRTFLAEVFECGADGIPGVRENLESGRLSAVAVTTTHLGAASSTTWVQARSRVVERDEPGHRMAAATLGLDHLMATMSVPVLFPAVKLEGAWHVDGVIRQFAPLLPAMQLGAGRVLSISCRYAGPSHAPGEMEAQLYPAFAQVGGLLLNSVLESMLDVNVRLLGDLRALSEKLPEGDSRRIAAPRVLVIRPSRDLGEIATAYEKRLPRSSRLLARGLSHGHAGNRDLFSNLVFDPGYAASLMALGEQDAEAKKAEIDALVAGD